MFDGIKIKDLVTKNSLAVNNSLLDFISSFSQTYGDVKNEEPSKAHYRGLTFTLIPKRMQQIRYELNGSLHRYFNGAHNGGDFSVINLLNAIDNLVTNFQVDPFRSNVNNLEFGVNVHLAFPVKKVLDSLICLNGVRFEKSTDLGFEYYQAKFSQHVVKIYDKGSQIGVNENILRLEVKVIRMQYLHDRGISIRCLADLLDTQFYNAFGTILNEMSEAILFDEKTINPKKLLPKEQILYLAGRSDKHWRQLNPKDYDSKQAYNSFRTKRKREENQFRELVDRYRGAPNWRIQLLSSVRQKWQALTALPDNWSLLNKQHINRWNEAFNSNENVANLPASISTDLSQIYPLNVGEVCDIHPLTGGAVERNKARELLVLDMSHDTVSDDEAASWLSSGYYVSAVMLRKNPKLLSELETRFKQYACGTKADKAERTAHNERNRYYNAGNNLRHRLLRSITSTTLFPAEEVIRLTDKQRKQLARFKNTDYEIRIIER